MRKIHINERIYEYRIGKSHVAITLPDGKKVYPNFSQVTGMNWEDIEKGEWKRWFRIKPSDIKNYLINNNL